MVRLLGTPCDRAHTKTCYRRSYDSCEGVRFWRFHIPLPLAGEVGRRFFLERRIPVWRRLAGPLGRIGSHATRVSVEPYAPLITLDGNSTSLSTPP